MSDNNNTDIMAYSLERWLMEIQKELSEESNCLLVAQSRIRLCLGYTKHALNCIKEQQKGTNE